MLTPYFAWRSSHRRHHIYANNMQLDHNYVPPRRAAYMQAFWGKLQRVEDVTEDAPIVTLLRLTVQQIFGFPFYLLNNITASPTSLPRVPSKLFFVNGHFNPFGPLFRPAEAHLILLSDIGVLAAAAAVYLLSIRIGSAWTMLLYLQPYVWVNHWIVAITYLHHTHPNLPKFEHQSWTFLKGALATIDRDFGLIGKRIPFYHAEEATKAIVPLLGEDYRSDKMRWFLPSLWESFTKCQWVEPDAVANPQDQALWYRSGPSPPPQLAMIKLD
ncbi:MAG: hypothetical protein M1820_010509 [Bogoriella megaspora]|nr:MAG: hypothetical protein M1820_010509 [Bogoriella megaspora]